MRPDFWLGFLLGTYTTAIMAIVITLLEAKR